MGVSLTLMPVVRCQLKPSFAVPIGFEHRRSIIAESFCCRCCCSVGHGTPLLAHTLPKLISKLRNIVANGQKFIKPVLRLALGGKLGKRAGGAASWGFGGLGRNS